MHKLSLADNALISLLSVKDSDFKKNHKLLKKCASYMIKNGFNGEIKAKNGKIKQRNKEIRNKWKSTHYSLNAQLKNLKKI